MPGSRVKEVRMNLPTILESAAQLGSDYEFLLPVAPTLDRSFLLGLIGPEKAANGKSLSCPMPCPRSGIRAPALWPAARPPSRPR